MVFTEQTFLKCLNKLDELNAILFFQSNFGLAVDMAEQIKKMFQYDEIVVLDFQDIDKNFTKILQEQLCDGFFSSKKIIKVYNFKPNGKSKIKDELKFLENNKIKDKIILFFANEMDGKSSIKTFFEKGNFTASIACYDDDENTAIKHIQQFFSANQKSIDKEAINFMANMLHGDRQNLTSECEKILLYCQNKNITLQDVENAIINQQTANPVAFADSLLSGEISKSLQEYELCEKEEMQIILFLRSFIRSTEDILDIKNMLQNGFNIDDAIKAKFIFWKRINNVKLSVAKSSIQMLKNYIKIALNAEKMAKIYGNDIAKHYFIRNVVLYNIK